MADHLGSVHFAGALTRRDPAATPGVDPDDVLEDCLVVNSALQASAVNEAFANVGMISPTRNWRLPHLVSKARASASRDNIVADLPHGPCALPASCFPDGPCAAYRRSSWCGAMSTTCAFNGARRGVVLPGHGPERSSPPTTGTRSPLRERASIARV